MPRNTEDGRLAYNKYMREYRKRPEQRAKETARKAAWIAASPENTEKHRLSALRTARRARWGSPEVYAARLAKQRGLCALCGEPFDDTKLGSPVQDHDHDTEELREFLHCRCNLAIANLLDSPSKCRKAAEYLEKHGRRDEMA
jgi:5-methylcytosine-specific restriction endonuclease McrA